MQQVTSLTHTHLRGQGSNLWRVSLKQTNKKKHIRKYQLVLMVLMGDGPNFRLDRGEERLSWSVREDVMQEVVAAQRGGSGGIQMWF